jgi:CBS domain-containing protein
MIPATGVPQLTAETPATDAVGALAGASSGRGLVVDATGRLVGILSLTDIARALAAGRPV